MEAVNIGTPTWEVFGCRLRYWRRHAGLTQEQLGRRLGYHFSQISRLETGRRTASAAAVVCADLVLDTGGELAAIRDAIIGERVAPAAPSPPPPVPPDPAPVRTGWPPFSVPCGAPAEWDGTPPPITGGWPTRLPARGRSCPLHGHVGCAVPTPADAVGAYLDARSQSQRAPEIGSDLVHALTAMLVMYERTHEEQPLSQVGRPVEQLLRTIVQWGDGAQGNTARALLRLAANYAQLAGWLRVARDQRGLGMAWFDCGVQWSRMVDDVGSLALLLCDMSITARVERDGTRARGYAGAIAASDPGRRWLAVVAALYEAPAFALDGQVDECERRIARVRAQIARLDGRDRVEAPWLLGREGRMRVACCIAGSLRDIASLTGDRAVAKRAIAAAQESLSELPSWMTTTRILLTLRLADNYACAGDLDGAIATAAPVLAEAVTASRTPIEQELRGFCDRVMGKWSGVPAVRELDERLREAMR